MPEESRFENDPEELLGEPEQLPDGWGVGRVDPAERADVARLTTLLREHEARGRGWPGAGVDDVLLEVSQAALATRQNVVVRDPDGLIRAWGSVHDRAGGRMLFVHVVERDLAPGVGRACSDVLVAWAVAQAVEVGTARGLSVQQIDTGAFAEDQRQHRWLAASGFTRVRSWWQMSRPVTADEVALVPSPERWEADGVVFRLVRRGDDGLPDEDDLREVHEVLESAFVDHFNHFGETLEEFLHRLAEEPGHRWDHWWLAELVPDGDQDGGAVVDQDGGPDADRDGDRDGGATAVGVLVGEVSAGGSGPDGSYVSYLGVLEAARGRGVAKGLLHTIVADAAARGRDRVGLEVDADSSTGADGLYLALGWQTRYVTQSWHRDVEVPPTDATDPTDPTDPPGPADPAR